MEEGPKKRTAADINREILEFQDQINELQKKIDDIYLKQNALRQERRELAEFPSSWKIKKQDKNK